ncbi:hypothetical protein NOCARDAX2BIS_30056 [Nocardioides sp. AX2bis]|nr:hypothetical protein NOCARDAX2BIS_30056 [Nocardioides sp. AX2bis]
MWHRARHEHRIRCGAAPFHGRVSSRRLATSRVRSVVHHSHHGMDARSRLQLPREGVDRGSQTFVRFPRDEAARAAVFRSLRASRRDGS